MIARVDWDRSAPAFDTWLIVAGEGDAEQVWEIRRFGSGQAALYRLLREDAQRTIIEDIECHPGKEACSCNRPPCQHLAMIEALIERGVIR